MKTANIVHPNDTRPEGPLTVKVHQLTAVEIAKRTAKLREEQVPHLVIGSDGKGAKDEVTGKPLIEWRRPLMSDDPRDTLFWYNQVRLVVDGWINPPIVDGKPAEFNDENLWLLFGEEFEVKDYTFDFAGKTQTFTSIHFPFVIIAECSKPELFGNPTQSGSATP